MAFSNLYQLTPTGKSWNVDQEYKAIFDFEYSDERDDLLNLYAKGKKMQWDAAERIDWDQELDWVSD